jgi:hypothetical protein
MALTDSMLRNLKRRDKIYQMADGAGLFVEVQPGGTKTFRVRYRAGGRDSKQEKVTLGDNPTYSISGAKGPDQ